MTYAIKEMFLTLQGEGARAGRRAVFLRFSGCNLWSGREEDRAGATCRFCDTDFVGTDGENGGRYALDDITALAVQLWGPGRVGRYIVLTGGEPMLQVDDALVDALHSEKFEIAIETNGTLPVHPGLDWICVSPKAGSTVLQRSGDELKLVWPQPSDPLPGHRLEDMESWAFSDFLVQPLDAGEGGIGCNITSCVDFVMRRPQWRLGLQNHKLLGLK